MRTRLILSAALCLVAGAPAAPPRTLSSPDGKLEITFAGATDGPLTWTFRADGRTLIVFSGATIIPDIPENYRRHPELLRFIAKATRPKPRP